MPSAETRRLSDLLEIARVLASTLNLRAALTRSLEVLEERHGAVLGSVTLIDRLTDELCVEAVSGVPFAAARRARYKIGEGITGRVVQSGRPVIVPQVSREPLFLNRMGGFRRAKGELTFIAVPIVVDSQPVGALGVAYRYEKERHYEQEAKLLELMASFVGQAVRVHSLVEKERQRLVEENASLREELRQRHDISNIIGSSRPMQDVYAQIRQVAPSFTTVLIRGESGTGKEMVAHAIHYGSPRAQKALVKVSCAALPESLVESELFGYEKGAFTDARQQKKGRFERAHGGTLFLDEVGELPPSTQIKLLRVLQDREFERLGGTHPVKVDVRLIAATNKDLELAVQAGTFREDLYYRLNVFSVFLPPLRERRADILLLADHFVEKYGLAHGKDVRRIATTAIDMLTAYHWPGNVRELENCIERAVLLCDGGVIHAHHLPPTLQTAEVSGTLPRHSLEKAVESLERDLIQDALKSARGNKAQAARLLDTSERILSYKARKYSIDGARFRTRR